LNQVFQCQNFATLGKSQSREHSTAFKFEFLRQKLLDFSTLLQSFELIVDRDRE